MRLAADMKLPGRGWLEFAVIPVDGGGRSRIRQTATFDPRGLLGRLYWNAILPIHALMFGGLLRQIAQRAERGDGAEAVSVLVHRSVIHGPADAVFRWHERPEALQDLSPSGGWVRIEQRVGGVCDDGRVTLSIGLGPLRIRWEARHYGYVRGQQFSDEQIRGPFRTWRHTHRVEAIDSSRSVYEDRIEYALPGGRWVRRLSDRLMRRLLTGILVRRHQRVHDSCSNRSRSGHDVTIADRRALSMNGGCVGHDGAGERRTRRGHGACPVAQLS
jgi:ligand-binding SRPBCC domain-containing protein